MSANSYCGENLLVDKSYFVVSLSTLYVKFLQPLNSRVSFHEFSGVLLANQDDFAAYQAGILPSNKLIPFNFKAEGFKVYFSHLIFPMDIQQTNIHEGVLVIKIQTQRHLNSSDSTYFYDGDTIVVTNINYYRASVSFEGILGIIFGVLLGLTGFLALFIPAVKYTIMSMKIFQMNNYFFLINVNLPLNLFLFFNNIQTGNIFRQAVFFNPLSFMANDTCKEFQEKLLALDKTCQLFHNAGPHMLWFGISGVVKLVLEGFQRYREKQGIPRGKLYEFLKLRFGRRYFIELLNYFHMDLVLYNLMNLLFSEMDNFTTFWNLFVSVILMVFFIYFYIQLFVIVSQHYKEYLLTNLCDPLNKLGSIQEQKKTLLMAQGIFSQDNVLEKAKTMKKQPTKGPQAPQENSPRPIEKDLADFAKQNEGEKKKEGGLDPSWTLKRVFDELKIRKFRLPQKKVESKRSLDAMTNKQSVSRFEAAGRRKEKKDATFEPSNIYRFLFINSHCLNMYSANYYPIGFVKEFLLALILVSAYSSGIIQSLVFLIIFTTVFVSNVSMSPLQNELNNRLLKIYSALYMTMSFMTLTLNIFDESVNPSLLYNFFGYILILLEIGIICVLITMTVSEFIKVRREKKLFSQKKNEVKPESLSELKPLNQENKGDTIEPQGINNQDLPNPISKMNSLNSNDSFKHFGKELAGLKKQGGEGGVFFSKKDFSGGKGIDPKATDSRHSIDSWTKEKGKKSYVSPTRFGRPVARRVESEEGVSDNEASMNQGESHSKSISGVSSSISKAKSRGGKKGTNKTKK